MENAKKCRACATEIAKEAKICPNCKTDQRNWFARHYVLTALVALFAIGAAMGGNKPTATPSNVPGQSTQSAETTKAGKVAKLKEELPVGTFSYAVNAVDTKDSIKSYSATKAAGVFKILSVTATNKDKEPRTLDNNMFKILDDQGNSYSYSVEGDTAMAMKNGGKWNFFLKQMQPNLPVEGTLVFDIPKNAKGLKLQVTGGYWSDDEALIALE